RYRTVTTIATVYIYTLSLHDALPIFGIFGITEDLIKMTLYRQPLLKFKIMKKCLLILTTVLCFNSTYSQILYSENFDNLSIGNLGTDVTAKTPGQGGWYTVSQYTQANSFFTIVNETGRGKVLDIRDRK